MTAAIEALIRTGGATIAFDTNAMFSIRRFFDLCDTIGRINSASGRSPLRVVVPSIIHMEMLHDIRQMQIKKGIAYDPARIAGPLQDKNVTIEDFNTSHAEACAERLARHFPDDNSWQTAKKKLFATCLNVAIDDALLQNVGRCPATIDWVVAGQVIAEGWIFVTNDKGKGSEFQDLSRKISLECLEGVLNQWVTELAASETPEE